MLNSFKRIPKPGVPWARLLAAAASDIMASISKVTLTLRNDFMRKPNVFYVCEEYNEDKTSIHSTTLGRSLCFGSWRRALLSSCIALAELILETIAWESPLHDVWNICCAWNEWTRTTEHSSTENMHACNKQPRWPCKHMTTRTRMHAHTLTHKEAHTCNAHM